MTKYKVLIDFTGSERTISCRSDVDNSSMFIVLDDNRVQFLKEDRKSVERTFTIVYEGNETDAKQFATALNLLYDSKQIAKTGMRFQKFVK